MSPAKGAPKAKAAARKPQAPSKLQAAARPKFPGLRVVSAPESRRQMTASAGPPPFPQSTQEQPMGSMRTGLPPF